MKKYVLLFCVMACSLNAGKIKEFHQKKPRLLSHKYTLQQLLSMDLSSIDVVVGPLIEEGNYLFPLELELQEEIKRCENAPTQEMNNKLKKYRETLKEVSFYCIIAETFHKNAFEEL